MLRNRHGKTFMPRYPPSAELAPRDVVSRSILAEMIRTGETHVLLDVSHLDSGFLRQRFPSIYQTCLRHGLDLTSLPLPVSPAAHYLMGGVRTDRDGRTSISGLFAAGEVACTGVHGANRLASNSLLEGLIFGTRAARAALGESVNPVPPKVSAEVKAPPLQPDLEIRRRIRDLMWRQVGLIRSAAGLTSALRSIDALASTTADERTAGIIILARLIATAALWREESRGAHHRVDFPHRADPEWQLHSGQQKDQEIHGLPLT